MSWFWLLRPWSYAATLVPFLLGAGLCAGRGPLMWANWSVGLLSGLFLQATVNLLNTWGDERSGVDSAPGAFRSTPQVHDGLVSLRPRSARGWERHLDWPRASTGPAARGASTSRSSR